MNLIHADAVAGRAPFSGWLPSSEWRKVLRGDLVTWFGFEHVETVRGFKSIGGQVYVITDGGNTSSGNAGSQSNGGGSYRRVRPLSEADGFARVDYPGGTVKGVVDRAATKVAALRVKPEMPRDANSWRADGSDSRLLSQLDKATGVDATALRAAIKTATTPTKAV